MTQDNHSDDDTTTMAELLEAYDREQQASIQVGDRIKGRILSIGREHIFVDTGHKLDGVIERAELAGEDGSIPFEVGDTIDAFVMSKKGGEIRLSKAISGIGGLAILQEALEKGVPIEGKVLEQVKAATGWKWSREGHSAPSARWTCTGLKTRTYTSAGHTSSSSPNSRKTPAT